VKWGEGVSRRMKRVTRVRSREHEEGEESKEGEEGDLSPPPRSGERRLDTGRLEG